MHAVPVVAVLGHGEAGSRFARDLAQAGVQVRAYDPAPRAPIPAAYAADSPSDAVAGADLVLSVNSASVALEVARAAARALGPDAIYADLNTTAPGLKRQINELIQTIGGNFVDVAVMGPVPRQGIRTFCLVAGSAGQRFTAIAASLGMDVQAVSEEAGVAAERKLVRSIFMKGMAAACVEARAVARRLDCEGWLLAEVSRELERADAALLSRLLEGSEQHAARRVAEMQAVVQMEHDIDIEPRIASAAQAWLQELSDQTSSVAR
jgi:3-hydroxyisobutyrate dehydrogenase-like beta-hydroxyacid dehydrogenase